MYLFSCEMCPVAFCEDCLPSDSEFLGVLSPRYLALGYRSSVGRRSASSCFIFCSPDCKQFAEEVALREAADTTKVRATPLPII